jgi:RNA polymerase sigma-70 factor (ECF subfamily)
LQKSAHAFDTALIGQSTPSQVMARREMTVLFANVLESLPSNYRDVILFRHMEGLSFAEVADRMNISVDAAKKTWARALVRLRAAWEEMYGL